MLSANWLPQTYRLIRFSPKVDGFEARGGLSGVEEAVGDACVFNKLFSETL